MKKILPVVFFLGMFSFKLAQSQSQNSEFYVVVGAFSKETNAKKFTGFVKRKFYQTQYELIHARNLYYVFVLKIADKAKAVAMAKSLQQQPEFQDCWVYTKPIAETASPGVTPTPVEETPPPIEVNVEPEKTEEPAPTEVNPPVDSTTTEETHDAEPIAQPDETTEPKKRVVKGKLFKFEIRTPDGTPHVGKVHHVDPKAGRDIASYSSDDYSDVTLPSRNNPNMTLVCGIFGYKEITLVVDYTNPSKMKNVKLDAEGAWVVPFPLERVKSGEYSIMYEVSFFKNSVAMQEKSKVDLDALVNMMQNNPRLKIRIHGHANGSKERAITNLSEPKNYFAAEKTSSQKADGTELSTLRASAVRNYLIDNGIDEGRMQVKGDGARAMIVPETHAASALNDRIEIQILKD